MCTLCRNACSKGSVLYPLQGGSAFSQLGVVIANPSTIINTIGTALPSASNFFVTYVLIQARLKPLNPPASQPDHLLWRRRAVLPCRSSVKRSGVSWEERMPGFVLPGVLPEVLKEVWV